MFITPYTLMGRGKVKLIRNMSLLNHALHYNICQNQMGTKVTDGLIFVLHAFIVLIKRSAKGQGIR